MIAIRIVSPSPGWALAAVRMPAARGWHLARGKKRLLGGSLAELLEELVDAAAHVVDRLLGTGIEGVRLAGGVEFEQRQLTAVVGLAHFLGLRAGPGHELEAVGQVDEQHVAILGVNAFFHGLSRVQVRQPGQTVWPTFRGKALNYKGKPKHRHPAAKDAKITRRARKKPKTRIWVFLFCVLRGSFASFAAGCPLPAPPHHVEELDVAL